MVNKQDKNQQNTNTERPGDTEHPAKAWRGVPCCSEGGLYEIHIQGHLDRKWSDWLDGLEMELLDNGEMILYGTIVDQAALLGVLNKIYRLNLTLLSVSRVNRETK
jgi:hypothetical protein